MVIFSGIQPTGKLHLGNYFGAIQNMVKLQQKNEAIFSIVDLHALTIPYNIQEMPSRILNTAVDFLTCGIDPQKSIIFVQSHVKEHSELAWILSCLAPIGELERMTQFKDKAKKEKNINAGLLTYPILQAADILLYDTDIVPIGEDQKQHLELTQNLAYRFNHRFGEVFKIPKAEVPKTGARIMSLDDPQKKMSKSESQGCLFLADDPEIIQEKIKKAVTDSGKEINSGQNKPALTNLLTIYSLFSHKSVSDIEQEFIGKGYQEFKKALAQVIIGGLALFYKQREAYLAKPDQIKQILKEGAEKAQDIASKKMEEVRKAIGLS